MASNILQIYETAFGEPLTIDLKESDNTIILTSPYAIATSIIEVKTPADVLVFTITTTDMVFGTSSIDWTPTVSQISQLTKNVLYECFISLKDDPVTKVRPVTFNLRILNA